LKGLVKEFGTHVAHEHRELADAAELLRDARFVDDSTPAGLSSESVWACAHRITG